MPLVINLSFGNTYRSHSEHPLLETYPDYVSNLGRIKYLVVGSGNEGSNCESMPAPRLASLELRQLKFAVGNYGVLFSIQIWKIIALYIHFSAALFWNL